MTALFNQNLDSFFRSTKAMDARLRARFSKWEIFALVLALCAIGLFIWVYSLVDYIPFDYNVYLLTSAGNLRQYYYADWILPLFWLWAKIPYWWGYALWGILNILCLFYAARIFGGNSALPLLTFQFFYCLFLGQIVSLLIGALALGWWGMAHRRWNLAGLGFFIASAKFQIGLPFGLLLWTMADIRVHERLSVLVLPMILTALSLLLHPSWPAHLLERMQEIPPYDWGSISLWRWIGQVVLLLWLPALLLPMERSKRFLSLAATIPLTVPYFQQADLTVLYVLPVGWLPVLLGNLGFLFFKYLFDVLRLLWIVPLTVYLSVVLPAAYVWLRKHWSQHKKDAR